MHTVGDAISMSLESVHNPVDATLQLMRNAVGAIGAIGLTDITFDVAIAVRLLGMSVRVDAITVDSLAVDMTVRSIHLSGLSGREAGGLGLSLVVLRVTRVAGIDVGLETSTLARVVLHQGLVTTKSFVELGIGVVVDEGAGANGVGHGGTMLAVSRLEDGGGAAVEDLLVEELVIHGETGSGEEVQDTAVLFVGDEPAAVGESGGEGHVDGDGVTVTKRRLGDKLVAW